MTTKLTSTSKIQSWSPELYEKNARFVSHLADEIVKMLDPRRGERILDIGCGDGYLTAKLASYGAELVGVDYSETPGFPNKPLVAQEPAVLGVEFSVARAVLAQ